MESIKDLIGIIIFILLGLSILALVPFVTLLLGGIILGAIGYYLFKYIVEENKKRE